MSDRQHDGVPGGADAATAPDAVFAPATTSAPATTPVPAITPAAEPAPAPAAGTEAAPRIPRGGLDPVPGAWRRVSGRYLVVDLVGTLIGWLVLTAGAALPWIFSRLPIAAAVPAVVAAIAIVVLALTPRRVRSIGYLLRDDDLMTRRGILFQRFVAVPYGRMQLVDITRGPLERGLGLATLKLVTAAAASNVTIPGLPVDDAERLRDHLVRTAETRRAGL